MASDTPRHSRSVDSPSGEPGRVSAESSGESRRVVRMGKYEVVQHIARGGMGAVYRARDTESGRDVALKVLPPDLAARPAVVERFKREARSAKKLQHENVVTLYEFGEIQSLHYLAMEFVEGIDLHDHIKRNGPFDPEEACQIVLQGARALEAAYEQNIVHRDIKPSNFLLTRKNNRLHVKLTDFGLARDVDHDQFRVTRDGTTVGTVDYMSPEQARDSWSADIRSDFYSLGCTWYHLLVGHPPFPDGGLSERLIKIMQAPPPDIRELDPRISDETWAVLSRLLAKNPNDRYQTPDELIDDLMALEGNTIARTPAKARRTTGKKKAPVSTRRASRTRQSTEIDCESPREEQRSRQLWYIMAALAALLLVGGIVVIASMPRGAPNEDPIVAPPPVIPIPNPGKVDAGHKPPVVPPVVPIDKKARPDKPTPVVKHLPYLSVASRLVDVPKLRKEIQAPWEKVAAVPEDAHVVQIRRGAPNSPNTFGNLKAACKSAPAGKPLVIEIHDNGPLFELPPEPLEGRDVVVRAGKGYRPLVIWDVQGTLASQPKRKPDDPLVFLTVRKGRLFLEGIELAWQWPPSVVNPGILLDMQDSDLFVTDSTLSAAGKPTAGVTLTRFRSSREARCRFRRCHARGAGLTALDLEAPGACVQFDGCLIVGGQQPLLRIRSGERNGPKVQLVRSTLVGGSTLLELRPVETRVPALSCQVWDSLLSRSTQGAGGELLTLRDDAEMRHVEWRGINSLYAGWTHLLAGAKTIPGDDLRAWQQVWNPFSSEGALRQTWPEQTFNEPASLSALTYEPGSSVRFAATVNPEQPLGCDLVALPSCRDNWMTRALDPTFSLPEAPWDSAAPAIPNPGDGKFHGARVDVKETDLGAYLSRIQETAKLGPKVVLHLTGTGEQPTSPIRLRGASLVLYFEEPADKDTPRLMLTLSKPTRVAPLVEVENGSLEVINGGLRVPNLTSARASHLIKVTGGDIRLLRCKLDGPQEKVPDGWVAAVSLAGSGDLAAEKAHVCAINESVIVSSHTGVVLSGVGSRLVLRQTLVVAGTDALHLAPGASTKERAGMQCSLTNVTFAARRAVLRLGDMSRAEPVAEPVLVQARNCAYVNPFYLGRARKAGLLVYEGDALSQGVLLWQGQRESFDPRLHFATASLRDGIADAKEGYTPWKTLWGSSGCREPRELTVLAGFTPGRWVLERLKLPDSVGASVDRLWVKSPMAKRP